MSKFQIDFDKLGREFNRVPLRGNEHRLVRVAFDLFRFKDGNPEELWQVQSSDDGEFLVRTYALPDEQEEKKVAASWTVELDKKEENLTVAYRHIPLMRLAAKNYGLTSSEDVRLLQRVIYNKINTDDEFVNKLIKTLSAEKQMLLKQAGFFAIKEENIDPKLLALEKHLEKNSDLKQPPPLPKEMIETSPWDDDFSGEDTPLKNLSLKTLTKEELDILNKVLEKI